MHVSTKGRTGRSVCFIMKSGGGPRKGASFERFVCKGLSLWISGGERDDIFWRTSLSGGRATIGLRSGMTRLRQAGDVAAIDSLGERLLNHIVIECKNYRDIQLFGGVVNDRGYLYGWWHELRHHAYKFDKRPMLIARQNGFPTVCLLSPATRILFSLVEDHTSAHLPRWDADLILFDCFLSEAKVPDLVVPVEIKKRARLA